MKIHSNLVGTPLKPFTRIIDWPEIMHFAASIDDNNPCYFDDEREDGIVAPPLFSIIANWPVIKNINDQIDSEDFPLEVLSTIVHYSEYLKIYRLIKPNDMLKIIGEIVAILPHRSGTHTIIRLETRDRENELVTEEYVGGMLRGVECIGGGKGEENQPLIIQHEIGSHPLWQKRIHIDALKSYIYEVCTDTTIVPIHTSKQFARMVGLPNIILQGTATLALAVKSITDKELERDPFRIKEIACKFTGMVLPNSDVILCLNDKTKKNDFEYYYFDVFNHENRKAISQGYIKVGN
ncbi:MAG: MaoC/PaaZ C-terminal domain-containing protein [Candidatus Thorarchaeota archaeon]